MATYLQFAEAQTVSYKVRVRNTGNIGLTGITYSWRENDATDLHTGQLRDAAGRDAARSSPGILHVHEARSGEQPGERRR